jgi:hypothetical protein
MLIDNLTSYRTLITASLTSKAEAMSNRAFIGDNYVDICELNTMLSILAFTELESDDKEELLSYIVNKYSIARVGLPVLNFLNIGL